MSGSIAPTETEIAVQRRLFKAVIAASGLAEHGVNPKLRIAQDATERPTDDQLTAQRQMRDALNVVAALANELIADKRCLAIVERSLEDALLYAGKGIFS